VSAELAYPLRPLDASHDVSDFTCGVSSLDSYLREQALSDQRAEKSRTYVALRPDGAIVGYLTLAAGSVEPEVATARAARGQGAQAIPVVVLARLGVARAHQGAGLGEALLLEALARSAAVADVIGARAVLAHALDERARGFYLRYGFEPSPVSPLHLMLLMKDIRATLGL